MTMMNLSNAVSNIFDNIAASAVCPVIGPVSDLMDFMRGVVAKGWVFVIVSDNFHPTGVLDSDYSYYPQDNIMRVGDTYIDIEGVEIVEVTTRRIAFKEWGEMLYIEIP